MIWRRKPDCDHRCEDAQGKRAPGRPRSTQIDAKVIEVVLDMLHEGVSYESLSIEAIAARAGVGKATIYRRWPNKRALVSCVAAAIKPLPPQPPGHSIREDLFILIRTVGDSVAGAGDMSIIAVLMPQIVQGGELYEIYQQTIEPSRVAIRDAIHKGIDRGEVKPDVDVDMAIAILTAPMVLHKLMRWYPTIGRDDMVVRLVDMVLSGISV